MHYLKYCLLASACTAWMIAPSARAAVPGFSAQCPNGIEVHATPGGPIVINSQNAKVRRYSPDYYEATGTGMTIGVLRDVSGRVIVSYGFGRADHGYCQVDPSGAYPPGFSFYGEFSFDDDDQTVCESIGGRHTECAINSRGRVRLVRQLSKTRCIEGQNWGIKRRAVWVSDGCRATFRNTDD
jgi:hypothetical protein